MNKQRIFLFLTIVSFLFIIIQPSSSFSNQEYQAFDFSSDQTFNSNALNKKQKNLENKTSENHPKLSTEKIFSDNKSAVVIIVGKYKNRNICHGSGFIIKKNGFIITNNHVIDMSSLGQQASLIEFEVILEDGRTFLPQIIKKDPEIDVALLKINASNLSSVHLGSISECQVGENVIIIGTPLRLEFSLSLTTGVISGFNRLKGRIQTSAIIHGGNSGGPAFNQEGEVIGISVAVAAGIDKKFLVNGDTIKPILINEAAYGITYLIPINFIRNITNLTY